MLPKVSIVVPARNEEKVIENCLKSLLKIKYPRDMLEIIVATDKNNTDRTLEICKKYAPKIKVILTNSTHCKAEALNAVLPKLKGEIVGIIDADCIVDKNCLMTAVKRFSDEKVVGVMGFIKPYNAKQNIITRVIASELNVTFFQELIFDKLGININLLGRNMFLRKDVLMKISGFDEYSYLEDIELSARLRRRKYKTVLEQKALTHDECPSSLSGVLNQKHRFYRGLIRIRRKLPKSTFKETVEDYLHSFNVLVNSFSCLFLFILIINLLFFKLSPLILSLTLSFVAIQFLLFSISNIYFKAPLENLLVFPVFVVMFYLNFYSALKATYSEREKKTIKWYRASRTGVITDK